MKLTDVVIVGAGPYGLSIAAYLAAAGVDFRIFGQPMEFWSKHMPDGMHLKSEGFASSLYEPGRAFTLAAYCAEQGIRYADTGTPVPREAFIAYGKEFQRRFVPLLESAMVVSVQRENNHFRIVLDSGEILGCRRLVVAVGLTYFASIPVELADLPRSVLTHSSDHGAIDTLRNREVAIIGAGASAIDLAAACHQAGARVHVLARGSGFRFQDPPNGSEAGWISRMRAPVTGIGAGWKLWACAKLPLLFRLMPSHFRIDKVRKVLGPAPCWFTHDLVVGNVDLRAGVRVCGTEMRDGRVRILLAGPSGTSSSLTVDHVIAATGYRYDVGSIPFIDPSLRTTLRMTGSLPVLSSNFESSVKGLYFVGITAANTFGPLLRFAYGAGFAAPRLARHLARTASKVKSV